MNTYVLLDFPFLDFGAEFLPPSSECYYRLLRKSLPRNNDNLRTYSYVLESKNVSNNGIWNLWIFTVPLLNDNIKKYYGTVLRSVGTGTSIILQTSFHWGRNITMART